MEKRIKRILSISLSVLISTLLVTGVAMAVTTISENIATGGTLTVTGASTLTGALAANGGITVDSTAFTVADTSGNVATTGTLAVTGVSTLTGALAANGGITVDTTNFIVNGTTGVVTLANGETIDNTTDGIITLTGEALIAPTRVAGDYAYGVKIISDTFYTGGAAQKSYMLSVSGDRTVAYAASGDSNDAAIKVAFNNYAANDTNFIMRGVNSGINNRSGGTLGTLESGSFGAQGKSGGTVQTIRGLTVTPENYGTVVGEFGGIDIVMKNEGTVATLEYGLRVRNLNNSIADAVGAGLLFSDTGANTGFDYAIDMNGASIVVADIRLSTGVTVGTGTAVPATCVKGSIFIDTDDAKLHMCTATNTWSAGSQL